MVEISRPITLDKYLRILEWEKVNQIQARTFDWISQGFTTTFSITMNWNSAHLKLSWSGVVGLKKLSGPLVNSTFPLDQRSKVFFKIIFSFTSRVII